MQAAKSAVSEFLHNKKHTVDIEQETKPAVVHERVAQSQHENITQAVDREIHQHHHQIHVQPIQDHVVEPEKHHHNVIPIEHREHTHGKDREIQTALAAQTGKFRDEREVLPVQTTQSTNVVVGEHVHHHIHDVIQPVVEREVIQPHVVHTTIPIHEKIEHEPMVHKGNVLPAMTMSEFSRAGHALTGHHKSPEHIEYEGEPLKIDGKSHVGFGGALGGAAAGGAAAGAYTHSRKERRGSASSSSSSDEDSTVPRSERVKKPKKSGGLLDKLTGKSTTTDNTSTTRV